MSGGMITVSDPHCRMKEKERFASLETTTRIASMKSAVEVPSFLSAFYSFMMRRMLGTSATPVLGPSMLSQTVVFSGMAKKHDWTSKLGSPGNATHGALFKGRLTAKQEAVFHTWSTTNTEAGISLDIRLLKSSEKFSVAPVVAKLGNVIRWWFNPVHFAFSA